MQSFPYYIHNNNGCRNVDELYRWVKDNQGVIENILDCHGAVLFRDFPISSAYDFDAFSASFNYHDFTYEESFSNAVRINLTPRVFTANEAPADQEIFLHHELAQTPYYPSKIFSAACLRPMKEAQHHFVAPTCCSQSSNIGTPSGRENLLT